jgi:hypothetical protein
MVIPWPLSSLKFIFYYALILIVIINLGCHTATSPPSASISYNVISNGLKKDWNHLGFRSGDRVPNITLYDQDGKQFDLSTELKLGQPVVLISGSYTCDVTRSNIPAIKRLSTKYGSKDHFFTVYLIEAHPTDVPGPYSPDRKIWIPANNIRDHVAATQPKTYQQRVDLSKKWKQEYDINLPVLVDNPDNLFWSGFGEAPNMAYVILPGNMVYYKQAWFNEHLLDEKLQALASYH